jgi:hypothetical protein
MEINPIFWGKNNRWAVPLRTGKEQGASPSKTSIRAPVEPVASEQANNRRFIPSQTWGQNNVGQFAQLGEAL